MDVEDVGALGEGVAAVCGDDGFAQLAECGEDGGELGGGRGRGFRGAAP